MTLTPVADLRPVFLTPVANLPPVSLTQFATGINNASENVEKFATGVVDSGGAH